MACSVCAASHCHPSGHLRPRFCQSSHPTLVSPQGAVDRCLSQSQHANPQDHDHGQACLHHADHALRAYQRLSLPETTGLSADLNAWLILPD